MYKKANNAFQLEDLFENHQKINIWPKFRKFEKISENAQFTTCTNFLFWCQQTTKTISKYNTESFGPVCQLWFVTFKRMRDSKPQRCFQQHKSLKVLGNATNRNKHINEASKQSFLNNLFKISCKYTQGMLSHLEDLF